MEEENENNETKRIQSVEYNASAPSYIRSVYATKNRLSHRNAHIDWIRLTALAGLMVVDDGDSDKTRAATMVVQKTICAKQYEYPVEKRVPQHRWNRVIFNRK